MQLMTCARRYPIVEWKAYRLAVDDYEIRSAVYVKVAMDDGETLSVVCTHLDHVRENMRQLQLERLFEQINPESIDILCGDFNTLYRQDYAEEEWQVIADGRRRGNWERPLDDVMYEVIDARMFEDALRACSGLAPGTELSNIATTSRFSTRIDFILRSHNSPWLFQPGSYQVVPTHEITDHSMVVAAIQR